MTNHRQPRFTNPCFTASALGFVFSMTLFTPTLSVAQSTDEPLVEEASLILEFNATDDDAEIVFTVGTSEAIRRVNLKDAGGRRINLRDGKGGGDALGFRELIVETDEPDMTTVLNAYPAGDYTLYVRGVSGQKHTQVITLSHDLPAAPVLVPSSGETVNLDSAVMSWNLVPDAVGYVLEIEQEELGVAIVASLDQNTSSFTIPAAFLTATTTYEVGLAVKHANGNLIVVQGEFSTL